MHRVLYSALNQAERWKLINRNPAALLEKRDRPKIERKPVTTIDAPTTAAVFDAARERRLFIPLVLAALCGLRRGEIRTKRLFDIDLIAGTVPLHFNDARMRSGLGQFKTCRSARRRNITRSKISGSSETSLTKKNGAAGFIAAPSLFTW
jgi:integrase